MVKNVPRQKYKVIYVIRNILSSCRKEKKIECQLIEIDKRFSYITVYKNATYILSSLKSIYALNFYIIQVPFHL